MYYEYCLPFCGLIIPFDTGVFEKAVYNFEIQFINFSTL
jgi:hypothetical protein